METADAFASAVFSRRFAAGELHIVPVEYAEAVDVFGLPGLLPAAESGGERRREKVKGRGGGRPGGGDAVVLGNSGAARIRML